MNEDLYFIRETLKLAKKGLGWVNPNPMVGAILVKDGKVIAKGYHKKSGLPHAEIEAIKSCKKSPKGAALYINLEPCTHFGKTPPCVDAIIKAGIGKVVFATLDPNPTVSGKGLAKLEKAGIKTKVGILENEARKLNETFFTIHQKKRPFIAIKFASSLDGKIATSLGDSKWITNGKARQFARELRGAYQAILVGINTVLKDNPNLDVRIKGKKDPLRIILDPTLKIPLKSNVLKDTNILIATTENADQGKKKALEKKGVNFFVFKGKSIPLSDLLDKLGEKEIISILVEGGGKVLGSFVDEKLVDKAYVFHAPIIIGGEKSISAIKGKGAKSIKKSLHLKDLSFKKFDDNLLTIGYPK